MLVEILIRVPQTITPENIVSTVDGTILDLGLIVTMRGSLKSFPGSTHWHLKRGRGRGTLELTWWPVRRRLWIKVQAGRTAPWIDEVSPQIKRKIESRLSAPARSAKHQE